MYPTEDDLKKITEWPTDYASLFDFIRSIWNYAEWGFTVDGDTYSLSTGGWSGNEEIIGAMRDNQMFWMQAWESSRRGGHYEFQLPKHLTK